MDFNRLGETDRQLGGGFRRAVRPPQTATIVVGTRRRVTNAVDASKTCVVAISDENRNLIYMVRSRGQSPKSAGRDGRIKKFNRGHLCFFGRVSCTYGAKRLSSTVTRPDYWLWLSVYTSYYVVIYIFIYINR